MNKDCAATRQALRKYLRGHVFKYQQIRISRHLSSCPVCRSEFQALQKIADTRQLLEDVNAEAGLGRSVRTGTAILGRLKILAYRPLWVIAILGLSTLVYLNLIAPNRRDIEIENIEKTLPPAAAVVSAPVATAPALAASAAPPAQPAATPAAPTRAPAPTPAPAAPVDPLQVVITAHDEKTADRVNEIMHVYGPLKKKQFTGSVHEISGALSINELRNFFGRVEQAGRVTYNRTKLASFPAGQPVPFIMKLKPAIRPQEPRSTSPDSPAAAGPDAQPSEQPASAPPQAAP